MGYIKGKGDRQMQLLDEHGKIDQIDPSLTSEEYLVEHGNHLQRSLTFN